MTTRDQAESKYQEVLDAVSKRAIWRVGEFVEEGETFRSRCDTCRHDSLHQRFDVRRHRLLFGRSVRELEHPVPMVRCRRCGTITHVRDLPALVVPTTIALHDELRDAVVELIGRDDTSAAVSFDEVLLARFTEFREQAGGRVREHLMQSIIEAIGTVDDQGRRVLAEVAVELSFSLQQTDEFLESARS